MDKMTLIELLTQYEIRIPIIQRDYAQGRATKKGEGVRKNLIKNFKDCLASDEREIDFNFIYGTISEEVFYPVDGQQRLTSLYLLHWYLNCNLDRDEMDELKNFSYMTRNSSSDFFAVLKSRNDELIEIAKSGAGFKGKIMQKSWFLSEWEYDPTVSAVLNFLDDLSEEPSFRTDSKRYFDRLKNGAVTFSFLKETDTKMNAEMKAAKNYIRMNARGKTLEPFENLKAMINSIDRKLETSTQFIEKYDMDYINILYQREMEANLNKKTKAINIKCVYFLKNIYNLCAQIGSFEGGIKGDENAFIAHMYDESQKSKEVIDKEFYKMFLGYVNVVFDYYKNEQKSHIEEMWEDKGAFTCSDAMNRKIVAVLVYIYHYYKEKKQGVSEECMEKYLNVLENLNYCKWEEYLKNILDFSKEISLCADVFDYFKRPLENISALATGLDDICVRIKEQNIKARIIHDQSCQWDYFKELEEKTEVRKLQYLLYIAGYWERYEAESFALLEKYRKTASTYYGKDVVGWMKHYAVTTQMMESVDALKDGEVINAEAGESHIWNDNNYYWNDVVDEEKSYRSKPFFADIKRGYDRVDQIEAIVKDLMEDETYYSDCWLKYGVKYADKNPMILKRELRYFNDDTHLGVYIREIDDIYDRFERKSWENVNKERYDQYIIRTIYNLTNGLENLSKTANAECRFPQRDEPYRIDDKRQIAPTSSKAIIAKISAVFKITNVNEQFEPAKKQEHCFYEYDEENGDYTVYVFDHKRMYKYNQYGYNLKEYIAKRGEQRDTLYEKWRDNKGEDGKKLSLEEKQEKYLELCRTGRFDGEEYEDEAPDDIRIYKYKRKLDVDIAYSGLETKEEVTM